jgi:peptidoglycan/xylan/chitin deacetylase (PgdA/CDA1 family)
MNFLKKLFASIHSPLWRILHPNHLIIFMIHGVIDPSLQSTWQPLRRQLSVQNLDKGLAALSKHYNFISMDQAVAMLTGKEPLKPYSIVLTFDDGYRNNITHALPVLQKHNATATFFLSTGQIERREPFWYDRLDYAIQHLRKDQHVTFAGQDFSFRPNQTEISRTTFTALRKTIKANKLPYFETMKKVALIANTLEANADCRLSDIFEEDHSTAVISWEEAKWATNQGFTLGSHTVDHVLLDQLDEISTQQQLIVSKKIIEQQTGGQCLHFCYPNGNWNKKVVSLVKEAGFITAVTTEQGANKTGSSLLTLHRHVFPIMS